MKVAGEITESLVHKRDGPSSSVCRTEAEYRIGPLLVLVPYLAVRRELGWVRFSLGLGHEGFRSRVTNNAIHKANTDLAGIRVHAPHREP